MTITDKEFKGIFSEPVQLFYDDFWLRQDAKQDTHIQESIELSNSKQK